MLLTFSALSEENRRRKELELNTEKAMQNLILKDAALAIREKAVGVSAERAAANYETAMRRLDQAEEAERRRAGDSVRRDAEFKMKADAEANDEMASAEFSTRMTEPGPNGAPSLSQRLHSNDPKEVESAIQEFANISALALKNSGKGTRTLNSIKFAESLMSKDRQARLAAQREARMEASSERSAVDRERRTDIMQSESERRKAAAFGGGASKKTGEFYPGGSSKVKVPGFGTLSLDQIREVLAGGGETATKLKQQLKNVEGGKTPDNEPLPSPWDDAMISEMEEQGRRIQETKARQTKTPSGVSIEPKEVAPDPTGIDSIFDRPVPQLGPSPILPSLPPVPGVGAAAVPASEDFFGLPRQLGMA